MRKELEVVERLVEAYNRLTEYMKRLLDTKKHTPHTKMIDEIAERHLDITIAEYKSFLKKIANLRNVIEHTPREGDSNEYIATPYPHAVEKYEQLVESIINPEAALVKAVRREDLYSASLDTTVAEVIETMKQMKYSFVPVVDDEGAIIGVFSESSLFTYYGPRKQTHPYEVCKLLELQDAIGLDNHDTECFEFADASISLPEIIDKFRRDIKDTKRLSMVFITADGSSSRRIEGIFTAWDALRLSKELANKYSLH